MGAIDIKLTKDGVEIQSRPIFAVREVALQFNLSIPIGTPSAHAPADHDITHVQCLKTNQLKWAHGMRAR